MIDVLIRAAFFICGFILGIFLNWYYINRKRPQLDKVQKSGLSGSFCRVLDGYVELKSVLEKIERVKNALKLRASKSIEGTDTITDFQKIDSIRISFEKATHDLRAKIEQVFFSCFDTVDLDTILKISDKIGKAATSLKTVFYNGVEHELEDFLSRIEDE